MSAHCHHHPHSETELNSPAYRRVLWAALIINAGLFVVEIGAGWMAGSVALLADAVDFFSDSVNYGLSLFVLGMAAVWRSRAALFKGLTMGALGVFVLARAAWVVWAGGVPDAFTMGVVGVLALVANGVVAVMLYAWRRGDANMRSVWICSRNDAIGNLAVLAAALGVLGTDTRWPDLIVAGIMGGLALWGAASVIAAARNELRELSLPPH